MSVWAFAFPLDALAAAAVTVYSYTLFDTMQVSGCANVGSCHGGEPSGGRFYAGRVT